MGDLTWKLVPVEPTPKMLQDAAFNLSDEFGPEFVEPLGDFARALYAEMLAASPPSPTLPSREAVARAICVGNPDDCVMGTAGTNHPMVCHQRAWERHLGQADRILALFTAPQPLAKPMPLATVEAIEKT